MKIIISPAKRMRTQTDLLEETDKPVYLKEAAWLHKLLSGYTKPELKNLLHANDAITELNYSRYQNMDLNSSLTPALLAYVGLQYQSMAPDVFTYGQWAYAKENIKILSGFYGILSACDGIVPYRLEMQAKLSAGGFPDLYGFWGDKIYRELVKEDCVILNLASKEYSKAVEPYIEQGVRFISCVFGTESEGKLRIKATQAKIARGEMVGWLAENQIHDPEMLKEFSVRGYRYRHDLSLPDRFVFVL